MNIAYEELPHHDSTVVGLLSEKRFLIGSWHIYLLFDPPLL